MTSPPSAGLFASLRQLLATALETVQLRLELLGNELDLEKQRLFDALLRGALALLLLGLGLTLLCGFVLLLLWDSYRLAALAVLTLLLLGTGGWLLQSARKQLARPGGMLQDSLGELRRDLEQLRAARRHGPD
jgi:uncharacterized membrane protein YqjE